MAKLKYRKLTILRVLIVFSACATILLFLNILSVRNRGVLEKSHYSLQTDIKQETIESDAFLKDEIIIVLSKDTQDSDTNKEFGHDKMEMDFDLDLVANDDLVIVTGHDPDPNNEDEEIEPIENREADIQNDKNDLSGDPEIIKNSIEETALSIQKELIRQTFSSLGHPDIDLPMLQISEGGRPVRNLIFSTWGSELSFMGDAISMYPATFYHYEPLIPFGAVQIGPTSQLANEGVGVLRSLLNCEYSELDDLVKYFKQNKDVHSRNIQLYNLCEKTPELCQSPNFLSEMCKLFPHQAIFLARMRLSLVESLLEDDDLDVRVLHLVRDPREIMTSTKKIAWCTGNPACENPSNLCADMVEDYRAADGLLKNFGDKILVLRVEDILENLEPAFEKLLNHFQLEFHSDIKEYLATLQSTGSMEWINLLNNEEGGLDKIEEIQSSCGQAMGLWGYSKVDLKTEKQKTILLEPPWNDMKIV